MIDAHTRKLLKRIPIEQRGASGIQVRPDSTRAFVACPRDHYVAVAGREPDGLAWWTR